MSEMIYGNTGKRDEGINIDMEQALYQKLQSRTFVPKLKSMLNDRLQEGDKNFVFIGEVADKTGSFSVYGYNAKLASDSRGGDYGHYIAVPVDKKAVIFDVNNADFLTEEGFVEYVNLKTLNREKRFKIAPLKVDINKDAEKRIVNNLMETFMKVRKRKNVTFSFEYSTVDEFTGKSVFVLTDLMKYIPYQMRKHISFISHVESNQKLPDMINLAAYPAASEFKPHDCISLTGGAGASDGIFSAYVEKVFSMSEPERKSYFEKLYNEIECPADKAGIDVRSDLYLLDVSIKELWTAGDTKEAVESIFNSVDDILKVYPEYRELAKRKIESVKNEFIEYISDEIKSSEDVEKLKAVYQNVFALFEVCGFPFDEMITGFFKARASEFTEAAPNSDLLIKTLDGIVSINAEISDRNTARNAIRRHMSKKSDINGIYEMYLKLKEKKYIEPQELNICLTESVEENILNETGKFADSKEKLQALVRMYEEFQTAVSSRDYTPVKEVYERYKVKFSCGASAEAVSRGGEIIDKIDREIRSHSSFYDTKNYIKELAGIDVNADGRLKKRTSEIYKRVSDKLFDELDKTELSYDELVKLIDEITPSVNELNKNQIYDNALKSGWGDDKYVPDGMFRLTRIFGELTDGLHKTEDLTEALLVFEESKEQIEDGELNIRKTFDSFGEAILIHWFKKHSKSATEHNFNKAEKELNKIHHRRLSHSTDKIIDKYLDTRSGKYRRGRKGSAAKSAAVAAAVLVIAGAIGFGGFKLYKNYFGSNETAVSGDTDNPQNDPQYLLSDDDRSYAEDYLNKFKTDDFGEAAFVIENVEKSSKSDKQNVKYLITVKEVLNSDSVNDKQYNAEYAETDGSNKYFNIDDIKPGKQYAVVIQTSLNDGKTYIRDIYPLPESLENHNFGVDPLEYREEFASKKEVLEEDDLQNYAKILKYIEWEKDQNRAGTAEQSSVTGAEVTEDEQEPQEGETEGADKSGSKQVSSNGQEEKQQSKEYTSGSGDEYNAAD